MASISPTARVTDNAQVTGNALVTGSALVTGNGDITSIRHVLTISPVGVTGDMVTIHRHYDGPDSTRWGHLAVTDAWRGAVDRLPEVVAGIERGGVLALAHRRIAEWEAQPLTDADHERWAKRLAETGGVAR